MNYQLSPILLVTGSEEFLAERVVSEVKAAVRAMDAEAELSETTAEQLSMAALGELSAPSLFSTTRCVVVRRLENLPEESVAGLVDYADSPADDVVLVLVHSGGQKGSGTLTKLRKKPSAREQKTQAPSPRELPGFVVSELRRHRTRIEADAASFLVQSVGQDLRGLASAASQLANDLGPDLGGHPVTIEHVKRYFGGRAEAKSFAVADHALFGRTAMALEELRWALERGTAPVLITSAMAGNLRSLARYSAARKGRDADVMREVGVPPWKLKDLQRMVRGWDADGIAEAIRLVARADADVKGQVSEPAYALERMILGVVSARVPSAR